ncbi:MAG: hypothetical protein ACRD2N_21225 [Vicinamibacterales bacterium]
MHRPAAFVGVALACGVTVSGLGLRLEPADDVETTLRRVGARVERYFARAQSLICLETVLWQPLSYGLSPDGVGRTVESELRLTWDPLSETTASVEAKILRQVLKINGRVPRRNDPNNCTTPEQNSTETQPLSMLLPQQRDDYRFSLVGTAVIDRRPAVIVDFVMAKRPTVSAQLAEGNQNCVSFTLDGGMRGRIWIDPDSYDVLRLDQRLTGWVDIVLPHVISRRSQSDGRWTMERWDTSIRFKPIAFTDPDETLILPVTVSSMRITRGSGTPRLRTTTSYSSYKRFLTGGRLAKEPS